MNDDPTAGTPDDDLDLEVRALLADARVTTPMPTDVTARLDEVLAGLVSERAGVADLSAARERRARRPWLGAAAAAVVVVAAGVTLPGLIGDDEPMSATTTADHTADHTAPAPRGEQAPPAPSAQEESGARAGGRDAQPLALTRGALVAEVEAHLTEQLVDLSAPTAAAAEPDGEADGQADGEAEKDPRSPMSQGSDVRRSHGAAPLPAPCAWPGPGTQVAATLDGEPATLVTRRTAAGTVVRVVTCADGEVEVAARLRLDRP